MFVVSGASNNHYKSLCNFTKSFIKSNETQSHKLIIYDLGIDPHRWESFKKEFKENIEFKEFDYSKYPSWYNVNIDAGQYAWKPAIIKEVYNKYPNEIIVWMDAGNLIKNLEPLYQFLLKNGIYSPTSAPFLPRHIHIDTINYFKYKHLIRMNRNGACIGFNTTQEYARNLLEDFSKYCSIKECIAPDGSNRSNHRQDQAVLTILYYIHYDKYKFKSEDKYLGFSIHNDVKDEDDNISASKN